MDIATINIINVVTFLGICTRTWKVHNRCVAALQFKPAQFLCFPSEHRLIFLNIYSFNSLSGPAHSQALLEPELVMFNLSQHRVVTKHDMLVLCSMENPFSNESPSTSGSSIYSAFCSDFPRKKYLANKNHWDPELLSYWCYWAKIYSKDQLRSSFNPLRSILSPLLYKPAMLTQKHNTTGSPW